MKSTRWMVVILLLAVCAMSWALYLGGAASQAREREEAVTLARENRERKLYQLAADNYREALAEKAEILLYNELIDTLRERYEDEKSSTAASELIAAYDAATFAFPQHEEYWEDYLRFCLEQEEYKKAGSVLKRAESAGVSGEAMEELSRRVLYTYNVMYRSFSDLTPAAVAGSYPAADGEHWGLVNASGEDVLPFAYSAMGPVGEDGAVLVETEDGEIRLLDQEGVVQARFTADAAQLGAYGEGLIPVRLEGREDWCYLDKTGKELFGGFLTAGMFSGGDAAVQLADGSWCLIGTDGQQSSQNTWEEVRLTAGGSYVHENRVLLKTDGQWKLYTKSGSEVEGFACDEIDVDLGEAIAFCRGGKWGFVNDEGEVVIEPVYEAARSFSGGVGAVCVDGKWGFVDGSGTLVVEPVFAEAGYFNENGICAVRSAETEEWRLIRWYVAR